MGIKAFKLESLYLDVRNKRLIINDKEIPYSGITDFTLTCNGFGWNISGKRNILMEVCQEVTSRDQVNPE